MTDKMIAVPETLLKKLMSHTARNTPQSSVSAWRDYDEAEALLREAAQPEHSGWPMLAPRHLLALTTAYEQGFGEGESEFAVENPYPEDGSVAAAWQTGYEAGTAKRAERIASALQPSPADEELRRDVCVWSHDDNEHAPKWDGSCGVAWSFIDGDPCDNGMQFCPSCGKSLFVHRTAEKRGDV